MVAFDKTGTLTEGKPVVVALEPAAGHGEAELLRLTAALQAGSEHPLARAVLPMRGQGGIIAAAGQEFRRSPGRGIAADVQGRRLQLGSRLLLRNTAPRLEPLAPAMPHGAGSRGPHRVLAGGVTGQRRRLLGLIAFGDAVKPSAARGNRRCCARRGCAR